MTSQSNSRGAILLIGNGLILIIAATGLFLRVWQLGSKNFWIDELGVAEAAFKPTLSQALEVAYSHIMAMPLDYIVVWMAARLSQDEGWLRLPAAVWGFLTLLAGYQLAMQLSGSRRVARLALLMLALSPMLVAYSQELRFYASLTFFYTLATYLGMRAVQRTRAKDWSLFTLLTLAGIYFHFYTILAVGNVFLWLTTYFGQDEWKKRRNLFAVCALILAIAFLTGLFTYGGVYADRRISLFMYESFPSFILTGLGWKPPFPASPLAWALGTLYMGFAILGVFASIRKDGLGLPATLFYSLVIQVILIIGFNFLKNYFLYARQIIMLVPLMIYFSASGVDGAIDRISTRWHSSMQPGRVTAAFGLVFVLAAVPALKEYYQTDKGSLHEIHAVLLDQWQPLEQIHVEAGILEVYVHYWSQDSENEALVRALTYMDYASPNGWNYPEPAWFIIGYPPQPGTETALRSAGFLPVYIPTQHAMFPQMLWRRK